jgi:hypothetical protein
MAKTQEELENGKKELNVKNELIRELEERIEKQ